MISAVVFDLDDTLYDKMEYRQSGFASVARFLSKLPYLQRSFTAEMIYEHIWAEYNLGNRDTIFNAALDKLGIEYEKETIENLVRIYHQHTPVITLPIKTRKVLERLKEKYYLALLTDGYTEAQQLKVNALGIKDYFDCIVYTDQLGSQYLRPSDKGYKMVLRKLKVKAENSVFIADNPEKDFIGANKLGIHTVQLVRQKKIHSESTIALDAAPEHIITSLDQFEQLIEQI